MKERKLAQEMAWEILQTPCKNLGDRQELIVKAMLEFAAKVVERTGEWYAPDEAARLRKQIEGEA